MNCWEFMKCGREGGGKNVEQFGICPAFPDNGNSCAKVKGTFCDLVLELLELKFTSCENCIFYNSKITTIRNYLLRLPESKRQNTDLQ